MSVNVRNATTASRSHIGEELGRLIAQISTDGAVQAIIQRSLSGGEWTDVGGGKYTIQIDEEGMKGTLTCTFRQFSIPKGASFSVIGNLEFSPAS